MKAQYPYFLWWNLDDLFYGDENILKLLQFSFQFRYWTFDQRFDEIIDGESTKIGLIFGDAEKSIGLRGVRRPRSRLVGRLIAARGWWEMRPGAVGASTPPP